MAPDDARVGDGGSHEEDRVRRTLESIQSDYGFQGDEERGGGEFHASSVARAYTPAARHRDRQPGPRDETVPLYRPLDQPAGAGRSGIAWKLLAVLAVAGAAGAAVVVLRARHDSSLASPNGVAQKSVATAAAGHPGLIGTWVATAIVSHSTGIADEQVGGTFTRAWKFTRTCSGPRCALLFLRQTTVGVESSKLRRKGRLYLATFNAPEPCTDQAGRLVGYGKVNASFTLALSRDRQTIHAHEVEITDAFCGGQRGSATVEYVAHPA